MNSGKNMKEARNNLWVALNNYEMALKSDSVIYKFCGSIDRIEGEYPGQRMLRIFRRDTRNPFAENLNAKRLIKKRGFPLKASKEFYDQWNALMDRDLVHFSVDKYSLLADLEDVIKSNSIGKVKKLVNAKFIEQGGDLECGSINFSKWNVESLGNIFNIDSISYKSVFIHINRIKFTRK